MAESNVLVAPLSWHEARAMTPIERFWHYVVEDGGCLLWAGALTRGRPIFQAEGKTHNAYVWLWEQTMERPVREDHELHHTCGQASCVSPMHLQELSHAEHTAAHGGARGDAIARRQVTHCARGHAFSDTNTWVEKNGRRHCRQCRAAAGRRFREQKEQG